MAGYRGHISGAIVFFIIYFLGIVFVFTATSPNGYLLTSNNIVMGLALFAICLMFGLWPDVDTNSKGQDIFYTLFFLIDVFLIYNQRFNEAAYLGLFCILPILGKHRGWTHTYWAMILVPSPIVLLPLIYSPETPYAGLPYYGAAVVGYFSHLFMDGLVMDEPKSKKRKKKRSSTRRYSTR